MVFMFRIIFIFLIFLNATSCSKKMNQFMFPSQKIDPYEIYKEGLDAMRENDFFLLIKNLQRQN